MYYVYILNHSGFRVAQPQKNRNSISGHEDGNLGEVHGRYTGDIKPTRMLEELRKVDFGLG